MTPTAAPTAAPDADHVLFFYNEVEGHGHLVRFSDVSLFPIPDHHPTENTCPQFRLLIPTRLSYPPSPSPDSVPTSISGLFSWRAELVQSGRDPRDPGNLVMFAISDLQVDFFGSFVILWSTIDLDPSTGNYLPRTLKVTRDFEAHHLNVLVRQIKCNVFESYLRLIQKSIFNLTFKLYKNPFSLHPFKNRTAAVYSSPISFLSHILSLNNKNVIFSLVQMSEEDLSAHSIELPDNRLILFKIIIQDKRSTEYIPPIKAASRVVKEAKASAALFLLKELYPLFKPSDSEYAKAETERPADPGDASSIEALKVGPSYFDWDGLEKNLTFNFYHYKISKSTIVPGSEYYLPSGAKFVAGYEIVQFDPDRDTIRKTGWTHIRLSEMFPDFLSIAASTLKIGEVAIFDIQAEYEETKFNLSLGKRRFFLKLAIPDKPIVIEYFNTTCLKSKVKLEDQIKRIYRWIDYGNTLYKQKVYKFALDCYVQGILHTVDSKKTLPADHQLVPVLCNLYKNAALACLNVDGWMVQVDGCTWKESPKQEAMAYIEKALSYQPKSALTWIKKVEILIRLNKTDEAEEAVLEMERLFGDKTDLTVPREKMEEIRRKVAAMKERCIQQEREMAKRMLAL